MCWSENAAIFERLMEIHANPSILYYGFNHIGIQIGYNIPYEAHLKKTRVAFVKKEGMKKIAKGKKKK